jgi:hypothetical protein
VVNTISAHNGGADNWKTEIMIVMNADPLESGVK